MAEGNGEHITVRINRWVVAITALGVAFAAGMGLMSRISNIEDAPAVHANHDGRLHAVERSLCADRGIPADLCDRYWLDRRP